MGYFKFAYMDALVIFALAINTSNYVGTAAGHLEAGLPPLCSDGIYSCISRTCFAKHYDAFNRLPEKHIGGG
eukprot:1064597-Karenia_brevis.AAC.1